MLSSNRKRHQQFSASSLSRELMSGLLLRTQAFFRDTIVVLTPLTAAIVQRYNYMQPWMTLQAFTCTQAGNTSGLLKCLCAQPPRSTIACTCNFKLLVCVSSGEE